MPRRRFAICLFIIERHIADMPAIITPLHIGVI